MQNWAAHVKVGEKERSELLGAELLTKEVVSFWGVLSRSRKD